MDTKTIIYLVAAALILKVIIKTAAMYFRENRKPDEDETK